MADGSRFEKSFIDQAHADREQLLEIAFTIQREYAKALRAELIKYLQSEDLLQQHGGMSDFRQLMLREESREFHQNNMRICSEKLSAIKQAMIADFLSELNKLAKIQVRERDLNSLEEVRVTVKTTKRDIDISIAIADADRFVLDINGERWEDALFEEVAYAIAKEVERSGGWRT